MLQTTGYIFQMREGRDVMEERAYAYWLSAMPGLGCNRIAQLMQRCGSAREVYMGSEKIWQGIVTEKHRLCIEEAKKGWDVKRAYENMQRQGISMTILGEKEYPVRLSHIPDPPFAVFYKGVLPQEQGVSVAIIGARACSDYGRFVAKQLGETLGAAGIQVISGLARGIDGISQGAALGAGGKSFGILGSGVDVCYPEQNRKLYENILGQGGIISEFVPGTQPRSQNFPMRNRIVSGLCDVLVVVEAREKSGTLITVDMALEQGKEVYVVPGRITDRLSDGCNRLLRQGASVLLSPLELLRDIREMRGEIQESSSEELPAVPEGCSEQEKYLYRLLDYTPRSLEEIRCQLVKSNKKCDSSTLHMTLMEMCIKGHVRQNSPGYFSLPI